jgi:hypothetical protein
MAAAPHLWGGAGWSGVGLVEASPPPDCYLGREEG